ncbi:hypothetical protein V4R08_03435 [Nitrobacter sp. NHB1]|uniref:hypothetical protein n=1 Tax=Nitrobacter sp. NHB1 TaxID=3119830 RepID=UPI002FFFBA5D
MAQSRQWCYENDETAWLSMLVEALEKLSDPEARAAPCDPADLTAAKTHLAHPRCPLGLYGSHLSAIPASMESKPGSSFLF